MFDLRNVLVATLLSVAATAASAATYTFDLQSTSNGGDTAQSGGNSFDDLIIDQGDLTGVFTGFYIDGATYTGGTPDVGDTLDAGSVLDANNIYRWLNGVGVCNAGPCTDDSDPFHTVDGASNDGDRTDFVQMSFFMGTDLVEVELLSLTFGWVGPYGRDPFEGTDGAFEILLDTAGLDDAIGLNDELVYIGAAQNGYSDTISLDDFDLIDSIFGVKAGEGGSWKLKTVVVDYTERLPEVPLPAAIWLLLGGVSGLFALRRR